MIGWHAAAHIHAANCAARFQGRDEPFELVTLDHAGFDEDARLRDTVAGAAGVLHFAGVNRAADDVVQAANPAIARRLAWACASEGVQPHIAYANSTHSASDTPHGRSKRIAGEVLSQVGGLYTDLVLPHIFGECARPRYNNVTATFIEAVIAGQRPDINPEGAPCCMQAQPHRPASTRLSRGNLELCGLMRGILR